MGYNVDVVRKHNDTTRARYESKKFPEFDLVAWSFAATPAKKAHLTDGEGNTIGDVPKDILSAKLPIEKGDMAVLVWCPGRLDAPAFGVDLSASAASKKSKGRPFTFKDLLHAIEIGVSAPISNKTSSNTHMVYDVIGGFLRPAHRVELVRKFEGSELVVRDLLDPIDAFFMGGLERHADGIWTFTT
jgi:hypothetical protein